MLALPVGPIGRDEAARAAWPVAGGEWQRFEREAAARIVRSTWENVGEAWPAHADDQLFVYGRGGSWARVRLSVEVLDGVL